MKITNRRAFFDYRIEEKFEAGINLYGAEVKAIRLGHADLTGSFVKIMGSEAYLVNAKVFPYEYARPDNYDEKRTRKLLLHKSEIIALKSKIDGQNLSLVPLSMYTKRGFIKLELGIGKGKKQFEKKEAIKRKDIEREIEQELAEK
ncbi:MAG: SsrA-binding protein SmpB [Candidatus Levyibacteriota bacterium]